MKKTILYKGGLIALLALLVAAPGLSAAQTKMTQKEMEQKVEAGTATPSELLKIVTDYNSYVIPRKPNFFSWDESLQQKLLDALDEASKEGKFDTKDFRKIKMSLEAAFPSHSLNQEAYQQAQRIIKQLQDTADKRDKEKREAEQRKKPLTLDKLLDLIQSDKPTALEELKTALKRDAAGQIFQNKKNSDTIIQTILDKYADGTQDTEPALAKIKALREAGFGRPELTNAMETVIDKTVSEKKRAELNKSIKNFADSIGKAEPKGFWGKVWTNITHFWQRRFQNVDGENFKEGLKNAIESGNAETVKDYIEKVSRSGIITSATEGVKTEDRTVLMADVIEAASKSGKYSADDIESFIRKAIAPEGINSQNYAVFEDQALKLYAEIGNNEAIKTALEGKEISEVIQNFLKEHKIKQALAGSKTDQTTLKNVNALETVALNDNVTDAEVVAAIQRLRDNQNYYENLGAKVHTMIFDALKQKISNPNASPELKAEGIRFLIDKEIAPSKSMKGKTVREIRVATNKMLNEINRLIEDVFKPALKGITDPEQRKALKEAFRKALDEKISALKAEYDTYYDSDSEKLEPTNSRKNQQLDNLIENLKRAGKTFDDAVDNPDSSGDAGGLFGSGKTETEAERKAAAAQAEKTTKGEGAEAAKDGQGDSNSGGTEVTGVQTKKPQHKAHSEQGSDGGGTTGDQRTPKQQKSDSSSSTPKKRRALQKEEERKAAEKRAEELAQQLKKENGGDDPQPVEGGE